MGYVVLALSALAAWFFWIAAGYMVPGGSWMFFIWADTIGTSATLAPDIAQRDVGFPLLIWLSSLGQSGKIANVITLWAAMAFLMPLLVWIALKRFSSPVAFLCALAAILSGGPYLFIKMMYPDQGSIFFMVLMLVCLIRFFQTPSWLWLALFSAVALADSLMRPAMNLVFPVLLLLAVLIQPRYRPIGACCFAAFVAAMLGYSQYRAKLFDVAHLGYTPSYAGEQVFYNLYINSEEYGVRINPTMGPAVREVMGRVDAALQPSPAENALVAELAAFQTPEFTKLYLMLPTTAALTERIWVRPNYEYMQLIDNAAPDLLLLRAAAEIAWAEPWYVASYALRNATLFLVTPGFSHTRYNVNGFTAIQRIFYPVADDLTEISRYPEDAQAQARTPRPYLWTMKLVALVWHYIYWPFIFGSTAAMVGGLLVVFAAPMLFSRAFIASFLAAVLLLLYNAVIVGTFADPDFRYEAMVLVLRAIIMGFGLIAMKPRWITSSLSAPQRARRAPR